MTAAEMNYSKLQEARRAAMSPAETTDGVIVSLMDMDRIRWDEEDIATPEHDITSLLRDPRKADELNDALAYLEALSAMTEKEIARQQARQRAINETAYQLSRAILKAMEDAQQPVVYGQHCTLKARRNPPSVRIESPSQIPLEYMRQPPPPPPQPDKTAIRAAIEADKFVPGAALVRTVRLERK